MVVVLLGKDALLSHIPPIFLLCFNNCIDFYPTSRTADLSFLSCDAWPSLVLLDFVGFILLGFFYFNVWKCLPSQYNLNFKLFPIKTPVVSILQCFNSRTNFFFFSVFTNLMLKHRTGNLPKDIRNLLLIVIGNNFMCQCHSLAWL